jgi:hypothetical protein
MLFDQCFMTGKPIPTFSATDEGTGILPINLERVNVLGSQIYRTEKQEQGNVTSRNNGLTYLERPGVLFDDLHTLWLMDCIRQLIRDFCSVVRNGDPKQTKLAVVLDNSPGYVGFSPAIHEWLTDCGPLVGKFLTVTSLDAQDIQACGRAVEALQDIYQAKWETSRLFLEAGKKGTAITVPKSKEAFFMRLATSNEVAGGCDSLMFYNEAENKQPADKHNGGEAFYNDPSRYIGVIINRVPRAVKNGHLLYDLPVSLERGLNSILRVQIQSQTTNRSREYMVCYDEYIENQFLLQSLQRGKRSPDHRLHHLCGALEHDEQQLARIMGNGSDGQIAILSEHDVDLKRLRIQMVNANEIVSHARAAVEDAGLGHLARLIHDEWLPGSILPAFRGSLSGFLRESELPYLEMNPFEFDTENDNPLARKFVMHLKHHITREQKISEWHVSDMDDDLINILAGELAYLVGLSLNSPVWHSPFEEELVGLFAAVLSIELEHWKKRNEEIKTRHSLQRFLATESATRSEVNKDFFMSRGFRIFGPHMMKGDGISSFSDFYSACTSAQARLIDFAADARFLVQLMQFMTREELERKALFPFVRGLAEDVIIRKTVKHEEAPSKMARIMQSVEYYREFNEILTRVLTNWDLSHG